MSCFKIFTEMPARNFYFCLLVVVVSLFIEQNFFETSNSKSSCIPAENILLKNPPPINFSRRIIWSCSSVGNVLIPNIFHTSPKEYKNDSGQYAGGIGISKMKEPANFSSCLFGILLLQAGLKFDRIVAVDDQDVTLFRQLKLRNYCAGRKTQLFV